MLSASAAGAGGVLAAGAGASAGMMPMRQPGMFEADVMQPTHAEWQPQV